MRPFGVLAELAALHGTDGAQRMRSLIRGCSRQVVFQKIRKQTVQVYGCAVALVNSVRTIGVLHKAELFSKFNEFVDQHLRALEVHVIVACSVDQ